MTKTVKKPDAPSIVITLTQTPGGEWTGTAEKNGKVIFSVANATLYHAVAGQLREYLDLGPYK